MAPTGIVQFAVHRFDDIRGAIRTPAMDEIGQRGLCMADGGEPRQGKAHERRLDRGPWCVAQTVGVDVGPLCPTCTVAKTPRLGHIGGTDSPQGPCGRRRTNRSPSDDGSNGWGAWGARPRGKAPDGGRFWLTDEPSGRESEHRGRVRPHRCGQSRSQATSERAQPVTKFIRVDNDRFRNRDGSRLNE